MENTVKRLFLSSLCIASVFAATDLQTMLENLRFNNKGVVTSEDRYVWKQQPCMYLEPENVTVVSNTWAVQNNFNYLYQQKSDGSLAVPPIGMRSSVPLGGISTGVTELRANGEFHEWTIQNQSPAGGAKITSLPDLLFAVRTASKSTKHSAVLQTHPLIELVGHVQGVKSIEYSGAYPVSKLKIVDPNIPVDTTLFAYSTYKVGDMKTSAVPAIAVTFVINNPTTESINVSLMMNLPSSNYRTERTVNPVTKSKSNISATLTVQNATECFHTCAQNTKTKKCLTWTFDNATKLCYLYESPLMNLNNFNDTAQSGLMGTWTLTPSKNCLNYHVESSSVGPSGDIATCILDNGPDVKTLFTTSNKTSSILETFSDQGFLSTNGFENLGLQGASLAAINLAPGQSRTITFLLAWYYPNRDFFGVTLGNQYMYFFNSLSYVVSYVQQNQMSIVEDISMLNGAFMNSSLDVCLQDIFLNSLSHIRSAMWFGDGRWRQWEAHDCSDMDSVHNDGERHIPYIMFFPDSTRNKLLAWARSQIKSDTNYGMIQEELRGGCIGMDNKPILDEPTGRVMSDVSSMFIVYILELYKWANDVPTLKAFWPNVKLAAQWHINISSKYGVPPHLVNTYDVLAQDKYDLCSYNSAFHLLALAAARELATAMGDTKFATQCQSAFQQGQDAMDKMQWNETAGYYNSYTNLSESANPGALMSDTFYSQVLAYSLGLGLLIKNESRLISHNKQTMKVNDSPYGLLVQTGRYPYPGPPQDNAVWQMANPNWATLGIHLGQDIDTALSVANKTLNKWREDVNDLWNVAGISGGLGYGAEGQPYITSHYGYFMSSWHLVFALSGQQANLPQGTLTFNPPTTEAQWSYPILLPGVLGVVSQTSSDYMVEIKLGEVTISKELLVKGTDCGAKYPLMLKAGTVIRCTAKN